jgi:uncharacterized protein (DUF2147 family)
MKVVMNRRWWLAFFLAAFALPAFGTAHANASSMNGTWKIDNLVLEIFDCQNLVCGRIVWLGDRTLRPAQCGQTIVWGLAQASPTAWNGGEILDPTDGKTYRLSATYQTDGELRARIFMGVELLGQTKMLRRVDMSTLSGRC